MRVEKNNKALAYRVPIGDYNYLQCLLTNELQSKFTTNVAPKQKSTKRLQNNKKAHSQKTKP